MYVLYLNVSIHVYVLCWSLHKDGKTPLHLACEQGFIELVKLLVDGGANVNALDNVRIYTCTVHIQCVCTRIYICMFIVLVSPVYACLGVCTGTCTCTCARTCTCRHSVATSGPLNLNNLTIALHFYLALEIV